MQQPRRGPHTTDPPQPGAPLEGWPALPGSARGSIVRENQRTVETLRDSRQELAHLMRRLIAHDEPGDEHDVSKPRR